MNSIKIEGGCTNTHDDVWEYIYNTVDGLQVVIFTAQRRPKIGDTIENGVLVDAVLPQINGDVSRWVKQDEEEWPRYR